MEEQIWMGGGDERPLGNGGNRRLDGRKMDRRLYLSGRTRVFASCCG